MHEKLLRLSEVATMTGFPEGTLRYWRSRGEGPPSSRIGRHVLYRESDVQAWIDQAFEQGVGA